MKLQSKLQKNGKKTVVVAVMSIFSGRRCKLRGVLIKEKRSLLAKRQKVPVFWRKIPADQEAFL
jgi:hypothetical protein